MTGHGSTKRHTGSIFITNLTDQDDIRVLPHHRTDTVGEIHPSHFVHQCLPDYIHRLFDRIFQGNDMYGFL